MLLGFWEEFLEIGKELAHLINTVQSTHDTVEEISDQMKHLRRHTTSTEKAEQLPSIIMDDINEFKRRKFHTLRVKNENI